MMIKHQTAPSYSYREEWHMSECDVVLFFVSEWR